MSKTVDERVVELRFDNQQFERNVQTSMSTLEKLKQSLNFKGASKGLENLGAASKNVDMSNLGNSVDTIHAKFSALQVMGVTALANITNSAVNAGKRIVSALTIDPIKSGFQEYETQINAVQTILANTQKEGTTIKDVNAALDELNQYADKTIYNFTEMTRNIGTFTAAGVDLDTSVNAIQGIANLAAVSGSTSQQASTAMYQLSQALASGTVKLMDWNSVVNAGMGGQVFQDSLKETARVHGIAIDQMIKEQGSFRETLSKGWLTSEILTETLQKFTLTTEGLTEAQIKQNREMLKSKGYTDDQIDEIFKLGETATNAATKVKTFTQLWDVLKEAAQSGWSQTWRLIIGDFEEAKSFFTDISVPLTNVINKISEGRNKLLESALGKGFSKMGDTIRNVLEPAKKTAETMKNVKNAVSDLGGVVDDVIIGKFGNGEKRFKALTKEGYNWCEVQNKVNEKLGVSFRYTKEQIAAQDKVLGKQKESTKSKKEESEETAKLTKEEKNRLKQLMLMTEEELRNAGYTKEQIKALKELGATAKKLGIPLNEFIDNLEEINGRWLLLNSIKNIGTAIAKVFTAIGNAWRATFAPMNADVLFDIIAAFHKFTASLILSDDNAKKLKQTFQGLFSVIHILTSVATGGFRLAFNILTEILKAFDLNILDVTSAIGKFLVSIDQFIFKNGLITKAFEMVGEGVKKAIEAVQEFFDTIADNPVVKKIGEVFSKIFDSLGDKPDGTKGLVSGIKDFTDAMTIGKDKANNFKTVLDGIKSAFDIQNYKFVAGLTSGLKLLNAVLELFGTNLFDIGSVIAEYVTKFAKFIDEHTMFINMTGKLAKALEVIGRGLKSCVDEFMNLKVVQDIVKRFKGLVVKAFGSVENAIDSLSIDGLCKNLEKGFKQIQKWIKSLKNSDQLGIDIIKGLAKGLRVGISMAVSAIVSVGTVVIETFKDLLGIHSPSTVFFEFGVNIIEGLFNGLKFMLGKLADGIGIVADTIVKAFKSFDIEINLDSLKAGLESFKKLLKQFDWKTLMSFIPVAVVLLMAKRLYSLVKVFEDGITGINGVIAGFANVENALAGVLKSMSTNIKAKALKNIAISIAILVGSIVALTLVDQTKLQNAVFTIVVLAGILIGLTAAMGKLEKASISIGKNGVDLSGLKLALVAIGASILMLAAAVKIMGTMSWDQAKQGFIGLAAVVVAIGVVFAAYGTLVKGKAAQNIDKAGWMILQLSVAMLLMVKVCKMLGELTWDEVQNGIAFLAGFAAFVWMLCSVTQGADKQISKVGSAILKISFALLLMVGVCKLIGMLTPDDIMNGVVFVTAFTIFVRYLVQSTRIGKEEQIAKLGGLLLSISLSLMLMVGVCKLVSMLKPGDIVAGLGFVIVFGLLVKALVNITTIGSDQQIAKVAATILAFSIAIGILAGVSILLSMMSPEGLAKGIGAVGALGMIMAGMIAATRGAENVKGNLIVMTVAIAVMAGAIAILSTIDPTRLLGASVALSMVMGMFALVTKFAGQIKTSFATLALMTLTIGALAACIRILAELPIESTVGAAVSLSVLLLAMVTSINILNGAAMIGPMALVAVGVMTLVVASLAVILSNLQGLDVQSAYAATLSLSALLLTMVVALNILNGAALITPMALIAVGVMTLIVGALALVLYKLQELPVGSTLENAKALSILLLTLTGVTAALSLLGLGAIPALGGVLAFGVVVAGIGALIAALGALNENNPKLQTFLDSGLPLLEKIGYGIGSFFGNVVGGFTSGATSGLTQMATDLSSFITKLSPFLDGTKNVDATAVENVKNLVGVVMAITGSNLLERITSWVTGESSMTAFGTQLTALGKAMKSYATSVEGLDTASIMASTIAAQGLVKVANTLGNTGGLVAVFAGDNSLATFGTQLVPFGKSMKSYASAVAGLDSESIVQSATAARAMVKVANTLGNTGGLVSIFTGDNSLATFGQQLVPFGKAMKSYASSVAGLDVESISASVSAAKSMVKVANSIPKSGGLLSKITGDNSMSSFGSKLSSFGKAMKSYAKSVSGINVEAISGSVSAAKSMIKVAKEIPKSGGIKSLWSGDNNASSFGSKMTSFGKAIKSYSNAVAGVNTGAISASATAVKNVVSAINKTANVNTSGVKSFKKAVDDLAKTNISAITKNFNGSISGLSSIGSKMSSAIAKGFKTNTGAIKAAASSMVSAAQNVLKSKTSAFNSAGKTLMNRFASGISSQRSRVHSAVTSAVSTASKGIRSQYSKFSSAGKYLGDGLVSGIRSKESAAYNAGYRLGKKAVQGEKDGQKSNSPSKLTIQAGKWLGEGLVIGIDNMSKRVYKAGYNLGDTAASSISSTIAAMSSVLGSDLDAEPTIRPVMDLSDVKSGASYINGMLGQTFGIGADANINAASSLMSQHNQNGVMDDVITAIDKLRKDLGNVGGTSYTINGITYDDGSNITDAIRTIVRAARVERRV